MCVGRKEREEVSKMKMSQVAGIHGIKIEMLKACEDVA